MPTPHPLANHERPADRRKAEQEPAPEAARFLQEPDSPPPAAHSFALQFLNEPEWTEPGKEPKPDDEQERERQRIREDAQRAIEYTQRRAG